MHRLRMAIETNSVHLDSFRWETLRKALLALESATGIAVEPYDSFASLAAVTSAGCDPLSPEPIFVHAQSNHRGSVQIDFRPKPTEGHFCSIVVVEKAWFKLGEPGSNHETEIGIWLAPGGRVEIANFHFDQAFSIHSALAFALAQADHRVGRASDGAQRTAQGTIDEVYFERANAFIEKLPFRESFLNEALHHEAR